MPSMNPQGKVLGILKPVGGGDPIPLLKTEVVIGRRRSCDICLDFSNISGKHCQLRLINSVWHVRDLGSTNGTSLNGTQLTSEHTVMPDDELKIASRLFTIDYEPAGPDAILMKQDIIDEVTEAAAPKRHSLMELAGMDTDEDKPRIRGRSSSSQPGHEAAPTAPAAPSRARARAEDAFDPAIPEDFQAAPAPPQKPLDDDDFLSIFVDDDDSSKGRKK
jgi:hypothetical protein